MPGRPTIWMIVGQGPIALAVGAVRGCLDIFTLLYLFSSLSPSLWESVRYRLKYCLKGPLNPKQPTNQPLIIIMKNINTVSCIGLQAKKKKERKSVPAREKCKSSIAFSSNVYINIIYRCI